MANRILPFLSVFSCGITVYKTVDSHQNENATPPNLTIVILCVSNHSLRSKSLNIIFIIFSVIIKSILSNMTIPSFKSQLCTSETRTYRPIAPRSAAVPSAGPSGTVDQRVNTAPATASFATFLERTKPHPTIQRVHAAPSRKLPLRPPFSPAREVVGFR